MFLRNSSQRRTRLRRVLAAFLFVAVGTVGYTQLDAWQRRTIFSPETEQRWWREPLDGTEVFDLVLDNGDRVRTWYWQHPDPDAPTILYLHGSRWNLNGSVFRMERWAEMGHSILAIDYRGFGESTPLLPSEKTAFQDASAALRELARRQPDASRRFIYGHSLGGAIAIDLATRPELPEFAGLIVESSFTSILDMAATLRWGGLPGVSLLITQPFTSVRKLGQLEKPVLIIHGTADRVVPHTMSDELFEALASAPDGLKRLVKVQGASHSGAVHSGTVYDSAVTQFIHDASAWKAQRGLQASAEPLHATRR